MALKDKIVNLEDLKAVNDSMQEQVDHKAEIDGYYQDMTVGDAEQLISSKYVENSEPYTFRTSGGSSDIGNREYLDSVVGGTLAWNQAVRDEASENSTDFADVVTVTDAVEDAAGVKVKIEPVQDLHGYDHPWPGGGSANKWDEQWEKGTYNTANGTKTNVDNQIRCKNLIPVIPGQTYYAKNVDWAGFMDADGNIVETPDVGITNVTRSNNAVQIKNLVFTVPQTAQWMWFYELTTYGVTYKNDIAINNPSTVTDYAPYSNICPITGRTGAKVTRTGKNLWGGTDLRDDIMSKVPNATKDDTNKTVSFEASSVQGTTIFDRFEEGKQYTIILKGYNTNQSFQSTNLRIKYSDGLAADFKSFTDGITTFVTQKGRNVAGIIGTWATSATVLYYDECGVFEGELTASDFEPYQGETYSIALPTEAGTVYGGELDVTTGVLTVTMASVDLGTLSWIDSSTDTEGKHRFMADVPGIKIGDYTKVALMCSEYKVIAGTYQYGITGITPHGTVARILVADVTRAEMTGAEFKTAMSGVQLVYELATPQTYQLTPAQLTTLLGTNNVWSDAGQTALTYTGTDEHLTLESGKKYLTRLSGTDSMLLGSGQEITAVKGTDNVFDLTKMFGTAVADYVYGQGAAFFRKWFPSTRYPYNAGELRHVEGLQSHDMVGFNLFDGEWVVLNGSWNVSANYIQIANNMAYYVFAPNISTTENVYANFYDLNKTIIGNLVRIGRNAVFTPPNGSVYMKLVLWKTFDYSGICISLVHNGSRKGEYEPYEKHSYPLDSSVALRGIPKVGANGVYWDGDRYLPDGTIERRYGVLVCDGTVNYRTPDIIGDYSRIQVNFTGGAGKETYPQAVSSWLNRNVNYALESDHFYCHGTGAVIIVKTSTIGATSESVKAYFSAHPLIIVYELATPTTETAQPYHSTQWVNDWGTEEFVSTGIVPVGHETRYPANLRDKLQHLPDAASGNGSYLITQTDGQMILTPFPAPPSTAGNYVLKATVVNGVATYTWEVAT